jgi:hypothetical protein
MTSRKKENQAQANPCAFLLSMKPKSRVTAPGRDARPRKPFVRNAKWRGEIVETAFLHKAASMGFAVTKPFGESQSYDFIVDSGPRLWRVQVKSGASMCRNSYIVVAHHFLVEQKGKIAYTAEQIDVLAAYVVPADAWYIIPVCALTPCTTLFLFPHLSGHAGKYERFREAWFLMACRQTGEHREGIVTSPACNYCPSSGKTCPGCERK